MAHVQLATQVVFTITKFKKLNCVYNVVYKVFTATVGT